MNTAIFYNPIINKTYTITYRNNKIGDHYAVVIEKETNIPIARIKITVWTTDGKIKLKKTKIKELIGAIQI